MLKTLQTLLDLAKALPRAVKISLVAAVLAIAIYARVSHVYAQLTKERDDAQLALLNEQARNSVLTDLTIGNSRLQQQLDSNTRIVGQLILQVPQVPDSISKALEATRRALVDLQVRVAGLRAETTARVVADTADSVRSATFRVNNPPHTGTIDVWLPRAPLPGRIDVDLDPLVLTIDARIYCRDRQALLTLSTEQSGFTLGTSRVEQDPDICFAPTSGQSSARKSGWAIITGIGAAATRNGYGGAVFAGVGYAFPFPRLCTVVPMVRCK